VFVTALGRNGEYSTRGLVSPNVGIGSITGADSSGPELGVGHRHHVTTPIPINSTIKIAARFISIKTPL
jgi:hypothetical protein